MEPEVPVAEPRPYSVRPTVLAEGPEHARIREDEHAPRAQKAGYFGDGSERVAEGHRSPVTEHDVEAASRKRDGLRTRLDQGEIDPGSLHLLPGLRKAAGGDVDPRYVGPLHGESHRPLGRPTTQLQDSLAPNRPQKAEFRLGHPPEPPRHPLLSVKGRPMLGLVRPRSALPTLPVLPDIGAQPGLSGQRPAGSRTGAHGRGRRLLAATKFADRPAGSPFPRPRCNAKLMAWPGSADGPWKTGASSPRSCSARPG